MLTVIPLWFKAVIVSRTSTLVMAMFFAGACGSGPEDGDGAEGGLKIVPRNRTLITDCVDRQNCLGQIVDYGSFNPYIPGGVSRTGYQFLYEPLYFYNAYKDTLIPWIGTGYRYNEDFTEVEIDIREGVEWSDGTPWTAADIAFTLEMLKAHAPELTFSTDVDVWVDETIVIDDLHLRIRLKERNPRFVFNYFTHNFDNGIPIVPKHIWEGKDPTTFANLDASKGWPVVSGPYELAYSVPEQRIWDLRQDWWAAKIGFKALPKVERLIYLPWFEENKRVQHLIANDIDSCVELRPPNIEVVMEANPNVTTWTGKEPPYGYLDWWPISLGFNDLEEPFNDPEIRWAINYAIDREQLVDVGWQGAGRYTLLPFPDFPPLRKYTSQIQDLLDEFPVGLHDPARSAKIMTRKGWELDSEGLWTKDGKHLSTVIDVFPSFQDLTPVLVTQLKRAGFDADFRMTSDSYSRMTQGIAKAYMMGNGGSVRDPYFTLRLYHGRYVQPTGTAATNFWRWKNPEFDEVVDQMSQISPDDPHLVSLFREAMRIWLHDLPAIPIVHWYHRIPTNETYWKGWPTEENAYINTADWHRTWLLVMLGLEPVQG